VGIAFLADGPQQWLNEPKLVKTQRILFFSSSDFSIAQPDAGRFVFLLAANVHDYRPLRKPSLRFMFRPKQRLQASDFRLQEIGSRSVQAEEP
jgi:hypothetical protein